MLYIGKANDLNKRLKSHIRDSKTRNTPLYNWFRKYGIPEISLLKDCKEQDWRPIEKEFIKEAKSKGLCKLNLAEGGYEPFCSYETRASNGRINAVNRNKTFWKKLLMFGNAFKNNQVNQQTIDLVKSRPDVFPSLQRYIK